MVDLNLFSVEIGKTGFPLEYRIGALLEENGWNVISGKYYLDDREELPREIDILAYKVSEVGGVSVYTSLIISCKKSELNAWALLSKKANVKNPNTDWWPMQIWTNQKPINYGTSDAESKRIYQEKCVSGGVSVLRQPEHEIFAFQEMNLASGKPDNDKKIYQSVQSLIQAQAYELSTLPERRKSPSVYQFNLLSVLDGQLVRINFDGSNVTANQTDEEFLIFHYIIKRKQIFSRIHFLKESLFESSLKDYALLHVKNCNMVPDLTKEFFSDVLEVSAKRHLFLPEFRAAMDRRLGWYIESAFTRNVDFQKLELSLESGAKSLSIEIPWEASGGEIISSLNNDTHTLTITKQILKSIYRYEGDFSFTDDDIPF